MSTNHFNDKIAGLNEELLSSLMQGKDYRPIKALLAQGYKIRYFREYLDSIDQSQDSRLKAYDYDITISHNGHSISIPFSAEMFNHLYEIIETAEKEF